MDTTVSRSASLAERCARQPWARAIIGRLRSELNGPLARGASAPPATPLSGWGHRYVCATCASSLAFAIDSPRRHVCPVCAWVGEGRQELDEAWVYLLNLKQILWAEQAAVVALADGDRAFGDYARGVLLAYAAAYPGYAEHGDRAGVGRIQPQSLCEAVWLLPAERTYRDLLAAGLLDEADASAIRDRLFAPSIDLLRRQTGEVHNIHVWHAAAIYALAIACGREDDAVFAERVLRRNAEQGVLAHGMWWEIAPGYHFYTVEAFLAYARAAHAAGRPCAVAPALRAMLRAPLALLLPDGNLTLVNDGWQTCPLANPSTVALYEAAEGLFGGFADVLGMQYGGLGAQRGSLAALRLGPEAVAPAALVQPRLTVTDGIAIARRPRLVAWVKATAHAGGHDHPDKPALNLSFPGSRLRAGDIGNPGYGSPLHGGWFARSIAHNALLVDGRDQRTGAAWICRTSDLDQAAVIHARSDQVYPGITIDRIAIVGDGWVIDWLRAHDEAGQVHRWQSLFHVDAGLGAGTAPYALSDNPHARDQRLLARGPWQGAWRRDGEVLQVSATPLADGLVAAFTGPDLPATGSRDCLVVEHAGPRHGSLLVLERGQTGQVRIVEREDHQLIVEAAGTRFSVNSGGAVRRL